MNRCDKYLDLLTEEGFRPHRLDSERVRFKYEGAPYEIYVPDGDGETFVMLHRRIEIDLGRDDYLYVEEANSANAALRSIKVWVNLPDPSATFAFEGFYLKEGEFAPFLIHRLDDIRLAITDYVSKLNEDIENAEGEEQTIVDEEIPF